MSDETLPDPTADPLADNPWERRVAELERALVEKNRGILRLEEELDRREQRLKAAFARLRQVEQDAERGAAAGLLPAGLPSGAHGDGRAAEARSPAERDGELRLRQVRLDLDKARAQAAGMAEVVRARDQALAEARSAIDRLEQRERELSVGAAELARSLEEERRRHEAERGRAGVVTARTEARGAADAAARERLEQSLVRAEQQADLYRKNLLSSEEDRRAIEAELASAREETMRLGQELRETLERAAEEAAGRLDGIRRIGQLESRLAELEQEARDTGAELVGALASGEAAEQRAIDLGAALQAAREAGDRARQQVARLEAELGERVASTIALGQTLAEERARTAGSLADLETIRRALSEAQIALELAHEQGLGRERLLQRRLLGDRRLPPQAPAETPSPAEPGRSGGWARTAFARLLGRR